MILREFVREGIDITSRDRLLLVCSSIDCELQLHISVIFSPHVVKVVKKSSDAKRVHSLPPKTRFSNEFLQHHWLITKRIPSMVIPLLTNQDMTPMLAASLFHSLLKMFIHLHIHVSFFIRKWFIRNQYSAAQKVKKVQY